jgi:hypothetical protein
MKTSNGPGATIVQGNGPVYVMTGSAVITSPAIMYYDDTQQFVSEKSMQGWSDAGVTWEVDPHYHGFVLVRGRQLDGPLALRFNQSEVSPLAAQYVIDATATSASIWQSFFAYTRLQAPGCYAYQVDGDTFSYSIIFQAVVKN